MRHFHMKTTSMTYDIMRAYSNQKYVPMIFVNISEIVDGHQVMDFMIETNVTSINLNGNVELRVKSDPKLQTYDTQVLKTSFNLCRWAEGVAGNFLIRGMIESVMKSGNRMFTCPFIPQVYRLTNMPMLDKLIPKILLMNTVYVKMDMIINAKRVNSKKFEHFISLQGFGKVVKD